MNDEKQPNKSALVEDLVKVQKKLPKIPRSGQAVYGKYANLDTIHEMVLPLLADNNLAWVTQPSMTADGKPSLKYALLHTGGESITGEMPLFLDSQTAQKHGGAITYGKRYAISAVVGITTDDDDDGNSASGKNKDGTEAPKNTAATPSQASQDVQAPAPSKFISPAQVKLLFARVRNHSVVERGEALAVLRGVAGKRVSEIEKSEMDRILEDLDKLTVEQIAQYIETHAEDVANAE